MKSFNMICAIIIFVTSIVFMSHLGHAHTSSYKPLKDNVLLCKSCGESITDASQIQAVPSEIALTYWKESLLNLTDVLVQRFENPYHTKFNVITVLKANVRSSEEAYGEQTWFPGYAWKMSTCPRCGVHLGWKYQPINFNHVTSTEDDTFIGLVRDNLLAETVSDTLFVVPQSYKS